MGSLVLPAAGLVYLDASVLIYSVERVEPYRTLLEPMWRQTQDGELAIVSSPIIVIETLVKPLQDGNIEIEMQYRELFESSAVRLLDVPYAVFEEAARLRAATGLPYTRCPPRRDRASCRLRALSHQRHRLSPRPRIACGSIGRPPQR